MSDFPSASATASAFWLQPRPPPFVDSSDMKSDLSASSVVGDLAERVVEKASLDVEQKDHGQQFSST